MFFSAQDIIFSTELDFSDTLHIKSSRKIYDVDYTNKSLDTIVNEVYEVNDLIFIDRNVYNLSPTTFTGRSNDSKQNIINVFIIYPSVYQIHALSRSLLTRPRHQMTHCYNNH